MNRLRTTLMIWTGCAMLGGSSLLLAQTDARMPFEVSSSERELAVSLADQGRDLQSFSEDQPVYLIEVEVLRDKVAEPGRDTEGVRQLLVTHYAADEDVAILTRVDPETEAVISVELVPHLPVRLSQEEFDIAKQLALTNPEVQSSLNGLEYEIELQLSRTFDKKDPQYGHRVVHLLFKTPRGYLDDLVVFVDITAKEVTVEPGMREKTP